MKPRLLDTFCKAGGATKGYQMAGFEVVSVDIEPQAHYCGDAFIQADALDVLYALAHGDCWPDSTGRDWHLEDFAAIHASPPCQYYTRLRYLPWLKDKVYWRSIPPTREALQATGLPYVIENVRDAHWDMQTPAYICGSALGLSLYRHRCFETWPFAVLQPGHPKHRRVIAPGRASLGKRRHGLDGWNGVAGQTDGLLRHQEVMDIKWMNGAELAQAIPPAYCEHVGKALMQHLTAGATP